MRSGRPWSPRRDSRAGSIKDEIDRCLARLGTDYIDLMQVHRLDQDTPVAETMDALERARSAGKIREIGVCNYPVAALREANRVLSGRLFSTQNVFNLLESTRESEVLEQARRDGVHFLAYSPLARGVLAGRHLQGPHQTGSPYYHPKNLERVTRVLNTQGRALAARHDLTLGQLALALTLAQPGVSSVIVGGRSIDQILENAGALRVGASSDALDEWGRAMTACGWDAHPDATPLERARDAARRAKRFVRRAIRGSS
jgi:aryl-alcohol dehydrogenase-like predicted oxidoreductase